MKHRQIQLVFHQAVNRVLKGAGLELFLLVNDDHRILVVVVMLGEEHSDGSFSVLLNATKIDPIWVFSTASNSRALRGLVA